jgi:hypothetical protein
MSQAREKLHSAREALNPVLGRRRQTTETELDECVQALEELKRACLRPISSKDIETVQSGFDEVIARIKNRPRKEQP